MDIHVIKPAKAFPVRIPFYSALVAPRNAHNYKYKRSECRLKRTHNGKKKPKYITREKFNNTKNTKSQTWCNILSRFVSFDQTHSHTKWRVFRWNAPKTENTTLVQPLLTMLVLMLRPNLTVMLNNRFYVQICKPSQIFGLHHFECSVRVFK